MFEAAKVKPWLPDHKGVLRGLGPLSAPGWYCLTFCLCVLLPLVMILPGCAAKRTYWGHPATDLSPLSAGTPRSRVDALLGPPEKQDELGGIKQVWYLYDRGFVGTLEETSAGEKIFWAPVMAWGELASLGLVELMIHCQAPQSMRKQQDFPVSIEVQLLGGDGKNARSTGNLCSPGTHVVRDDRLITQHCVSSKSKTYHGDQWVTAEVEVHGNDVIKHLINGDVVLEYEQPQLDEKDADAKKLIKDGNPMLREGYISLQAESHPVEFRKVEILPLEQ